VSACTRLYVTMAFHFRRRMAVQERVYSLNLKQASKFLQGASIVYNDLDIEPSCRYGTLHLTLYGTLEARNMHFVACSAMLYTMTWCDVVQTKPGLMFRLDDSLIESGYLFSRWTNSDDIEPTLNRHLIWTRGILNPFASYPMTIYLIFPEDSTCSFRAKLAWE
jgi:hypothetical protein